MSAGSPVFDSLMKLSCRCFAVGMDPNDFAEMVKGVETWDDWIRNSFKYADERIQLAEEALADDRRLSAGQYYIEASIYYHFAVLGYLDDIDKRASVREMSVKTYALGLDLVDPPIKRLDIPFDNITMAAHLRLPLQSAYPVPVVVMLPGSDSTKEEFFMLTEVMVKRGLATLVIEGPGQGETRKLMPLLPLETYDRAFSTALDFLNGIPEVDTSRVGVYGRSFGGHLAPRVAAYDNRVRAVVSAGTMFDLKYWDNLPASSIKNYLHTWGKSLEEAREFAMNELTLEHIIPQIACPFLIVHTGNDGRHPADTGQKMMDLTKCDAELKIYEEGTHVADNVPYKYQRYVADWLVKKLR